MPFGAMGTRVGDVLFSTSTALTQAASPLNSPWISTEGLSKILLQGAVAGGTTTIKLQASFDGINPDTDLEQTFAAPTAAGVTLDTAAQWVRINIVQTVADATKTKLVFKALART